MPNIKYRKIETLCKTDKCQNMVVAKNLCKQCYQKKYQQIYQKIRYIKTPKRFLTVISDTTEKEKEDIENYLIMNKIKNSIKSNKRKIIYTEKKYEKDVNKLINIIKTSELKDFSVIYAIPRGGVPLGTELSERLKITLKTRLNDVLTYMVEHKINSDQILVVDDIVDSGQTLLKVKHKLPQCFFISLWRKHSCDFIPDLSINMCMDNVWIKFPWEKEDEEMELTGTQI